MSLLVKICGLRKADDVKAAVSAGADAVGFVFAESVRRVSPSEALKLTQYLPKRVRRVAVMRHPTQSEWQEVLDTFSPDVLQTDIDDFEPSAPQGAPDPAGSAWGGALGDAVRHGSVGFYSA